MAYNFRERFAGLLPGGFLPTWISQTPFTDFHQLDLDWILRAIRAVLDQMKYYFIDGGSKETIEEVMEEHPEWWPRVMDGAITSAQINSEFLKEIENPYVTPQMYGAVGDGIADDTIAIQNCIDDNPVANIYFPKGTYLISSTINTHFGAGYSQSLLLDRYAVITTNNALNPMLNIGGVYEGDPGYRFTINEREVLDGGVFDSNNIAACAVQFTNFRYYSARNITVLNSTDRDVQIGSAYSHSRSGFSGNNWSISNWYTNANARAILSKAPDARLTDIYAYGHSIGLESEETVFLTRAHFLALNVNYAGSKGVISSGQMSVFDNVYIDNYETSWTLKNDAIITNSLTYFYMTRTEVADITNVLPTIFKWDGNTYKNVKINGYKVNSIDGNNIFTYIDCTAAASAGLFNMLHHVKISNFYRTTKDNGHDYIRYYETENTNSSEHNIISQDDASYRVTSGKYLKIASIGVCAGSKVVTFNMRLNNTYAGRIFKDDVTIRIIQDQAAGYAYNSSNVNPFTNITINSHAGQLNTYILGYESVTDESGRAISLYSIYATPAANELRENINGQFELTNDSYMYYYTHINDISNTAPTNTLLSVSAT